MPWKQETIDRKELYEAVWFEPMTSLCKRFGISDAGLRKVCVKLSVPLPGPGHWSKVRAGRRVPPPPLPLESRHKQHVFKRWVASESETDAWVAPPKFRESPELEVHAPANRTEWHESVRSTELELSTTKRRDERGRLVCRAPGSHEVLVTEKMRARALEVCELLLCAFAPFGVAVEEGKSSPERPRALLGQNWAVWRVSEVGSTEVDGGARAASRRGGASRRNLPQPSLRVDFFWEGTTTIALTARDTAGSPLERRAGKLIIDLLLASKVATAKAEEFERERSLRQEQLRARVFAYELRKHELAALVDAEEAAERYRRATTLRSYASAIEKTSHDGEPLRPSQREQRVRWIRRAADWLDPTTSVRWPEVDEAPETPF